MNTINVIKNKGVLTADISVSKELWSAILRDRDIATDNALCALFAFYFFPERGGTCSEAVEKYGHNVQYFKNNIQIFGKKAAEKLGIKIIGTDGYDSYWIVAMGKGFKTKDGKFHWELRPELADALQDFLLEKAMQQYSANFDNPVPGIDTSDWDREQYKWENLRTFKDNWDVNAMNFAEMVKASLSKTGNLMTSRNNYPKKMLLEISEDDPEFARGIFKLLYDESKDLQERITVFCDKAEEWVHSHRGENLTSYQDTNSTSTLLWLRYPEKYYIYKYGELKNIATKLGIANRPKANGTVEAMLRGFELYNQFNGLVVNNQTICQKLDAKIEASPEKFYNDSTYHTLTQDFGYWVGRYFTDIMKQLDPEFDSEQDDAIQDKNQQILKVTFKDGRIVFEKDAVATFVRTIELIGPELLADKPWGHKNYEKYDVSATPWPEKYSNKVKRLGKYWIYVNHSTKFLKENLQDYSDNLNLELEIETVDKSSWVPVDSVPTENIEPYDKEFFLNEVFMTPEDYERLHKLLLYKKNIILQGAPGVGKTFSAKRLAYAVMGQKDDSRMEIVQFHQNYSYEDFIMGYKPDENGFKLKKGIFYEFCHRARNDRERPYFFIIDEINRGNLSRIFGELLQLIENSYRDKSIKLAYNGEEFSVPSNLHIIGMMNTADRSLAMIDYALRRRFSFFTMRPGFDTEGFKNHIAGYEDKRIDNTVAGIKLLNAEIAKDDSLGEGFCIGHSYLCQDAEGKEPDLDNVINFDIAPMLEEYWFDNADKRNQELSKLQDLLK